MKLKLFPLDHPVLDDIDNETLSLKLLLVVLVVFVVADRRRHLLAAVILHIYIRLESRIIL